MIALTATGVRGDDDVTFTPDEVEPPPAKPAAAPALPKVRVAGQGAPRLQLYLYDEGGLSTEALTTIDRGARSGLAGSPVELLTLDQALTEEAAQQAALNQADAANDAAAGQIRNLDIDGALAGLTTAVVKYEANLTAVMARDGNLDKVASAYRQMAIASFLNQDEGGAKAALEHLFVLTPDVQWSRALFPPQIKQLLTDERLRMGVLEKGSLDVTATPRGAQVWLNGKPVGDAPVHLDSLVPGPNYVTILAPLHPPYTETVEIETAANARVKLAAPSYTPDPVKLFAAARAELGQATMGPALTAAARRLGPPELLLCVVPSAGGGKLAMTGYLYDTRTARLLKQSQAEGEPEYPAPTAESLARAVTAGVRLDGVIPVLPKVPAGPGALSRFRRSKWFWPVIGGSAAVVVGVVVGVVVASQQQDNRVRNQLFVLPALGAAF